jgi:HEAT repeat protein
MAILAELRAGAELDELSSGLAGVIAELYRDTEDPELRRYLLYSLALGWEGQTQLQQPLLDALANDPDVRMRREAASLLGRAIDYPDVRRALEIAQRRDSSESVRQLAASLLITDAERRTQAREQLFDRNANVRTRLTAYGAFFDSAVDAYVVDSPMQRELLDIAGDTRFLSAREDALVRFSGTHSPDPELRRRCSCCSCTTRSPAYARLQDGRLATTLTGR